MRHALIRIAIYAYPRWWKRRYGSEVEQLAIDALASDSRARAVFRVVISLVWGGISKRVHRVKTLPGLAVISVSAAVLIAVLGLARRSGSPATTFARATELAHVLRVGGDSYHVWTLEATHRGGPRRLVLRLERISEFMLADAQTHAAGSGVG